MDDQAALEYLAKALACDQHGQWQEGILAKQAEILGNLARRRQERQRLLHDHSSRYLEPEEWE